MNVTSVDLEKAVEITHGVCLLPVGCLERHSDHLPCGTDSLLAYKLACLGAEREPAVVFPVQHYMMVASAKHVPGAIVFDAKLILQILEITIEEIARNGFNKIVIFNFHGGNRNILPLLLKNLLVQGKKDYAVYVHPFDWSDKDIYKKHCTSDFGGHACEWETSLMLHLFPELVHMNRVPLDDVGQPQNRLQELKEAGIKTSVDWYADHPTHYAGISKYATAEKGKFFVEKIVADLARTIKTVKADDKVLRLLAEFNA